MIAKMGKLKEYHQVKTELKPEEFKEKDSKGKTTYHYCARHGCLDIIANQPEHGYDLEQLKIQDHQGTTPLHEAAGSCKISKIPNLEQISSDAFRIYNHSGDTPIECAVINGCFDQIPNNALTSANIFSTKSRKDTIQTILIYSPKDLNRISIPILANALKKHPDLASKIEVSLKDAVVIEIKNYLKKKKNREKIRSQTNVINFE